MELCGARRISTGLQGPALSHALQAAVLPEPETIPPFPVPPLQELLPRREAVEKPRGSAEPHPRGLRAAARPHEPQLNDLICTRLPEQVRRFPPLVGKDLHSFKRHDGCSL